MDKLTELARSAGMGIDEMLESGSYDCVAWGICSNCDYTTEVEPDQSAGYCECCGTPTVKSCLVLAGII